MSIYGTISTVLIEKEDYMPYYVRISTDAFRPFRCSAMNWEPGTINSQMAALNGWTSRERSLLEVRWRIEMFLRGSALSAHMNPEELAAYKRWARQPKNRIVYMDLPCGVEREMRPECPPWHQGYASVEKLLDLLRTNGKVQIPFSFAYDSRQYSRRMDRCFMEIRYEGGRKQVKSKG